MRVLIGCECSGVVREAFRSRGIDAWSCDLLPSSDGSEFHIQCDLLDLLDQPLRMLQHSFQLLIAHPPCDYLTISAAWAFNDPNFERYPDVGYHQKVKPGTLTGKARREVRDMAVEFFLALWNCGVERICIENPVGFMNTHPGLPQEFPERQIIQPYNFGDDASKKTCLWLKGIPPLKHTGYAQPRMVNGRPRWSNQTDSGQNNLSPTKDRASIRAVTYTGIAKAMSEQWGDLS